VDKQLKILKMVASRLKQSLIRKLIVILLCGTVIPTLLIASLSFILIQNIVFDNSFQSIQASQNAMANSVEMMYTRLSSVADYMVFDEVLYRLLTSSDDPDALFQKFQDINYLSRTLFPTQAVTLRNDSLFLVYDNNWNAYTNYSSDNQALTIDVMASRIKTRYLDSNQQTSPKLMWIGTEAELFPASRQVFIRPLQTGSGYKYGWLVILVNTSMLTDIIGKSNPGSFFTNYLTDDTGKIIYADEKANLNRNIGEILTRIRQDTRGYSFAELAGHQLMVSQSIGPDDTRLVSTVNTDFILQDMRPYSLLVIIIVTAVLTGVMIIELRILFRVTRTLRLLSEKAGLISQGDFQQQIAVAGQDEISTLARCMNEMTVHIQNLFESTIRQEQQAIQLEIAFYQTRLNPHFLLNTLNAIKWMAVAQHMEPMVDVMSWLGSILESSIRNFTGFVKVREEIELLQCYVNINKLRYQDSFEVHYSLSEEVLDLYTLNLLLQPIVENAIFHGMGRKPSIDIYVDVHLKDDYLIFTVTDTGIGMNDEALAAAFSERPGSRVGLLACKKRIELRYKSPCGIEIMSQPKKGTTVQVTLPVLRTDPGISIVQIGGRLD
jgi:two-component system, sensor histidine kinase YesM